MQDYIRWTKKEEKKNLPDWSKTVTGLKLWKKVDVKKK